MQKSMNYGVETQCQEVPLTFPPQHQERQPGLEYLMTPLPVFDNPDYSGTGKLKNKTAIITGGDSGIGRAVAFAFAKEGADIAIVYLDEHKDAAETQLLIQEIGRNCLLLPVDLRATDAGKQITAAVLQTFGHIDVLINNAGVQFPQKSLLQISDQQLQTTFEVNIQSMFRLTREVLPHLAPGSSIVNTASCQAYIADEQLLDYASTKGAIISFTRALAHSLAPQQIRVNAVAPGPIWTPLQPAAWSAEKIKTFGANTPMKRAGQPYELAPAYVLLASDDGSYITGQTIHVNGGQTMAT